MSLPLPDVPREPLHTRTITVNSFARTDGQWDIEAELIDLKAYDFIKKDGSTHAAGAPIHHMHLRVTIDADYTITAAAANYAAAPYGPHCAGIAPDYSNLVGLNLLRNFRRAVKERFSRAAGCTHMTELSHVLPTVAVQTMANRRNQDRDTGRTPGKRPFQLGGCHALKLDGPVVKEHYPTWYASRADYSGTG